MNSGPGRADVLLACSSGGHLLQLFALRDAWKDFSRVWVTEGTTDAKSLLANEAVVIGHWPAERSIANLARNLILAWQLFSAVRPKVVLTTGAALAVPFAWVARLRGAKVVYVESVTRIEALSLGGRLIAPLANRVYVQWPEIALTMKRARYVGAVFSTE